MNTDPGKQGKMKWFYRVTGILLFVYVAVRAVCVNMTYDEIWTIHDFVRLDVWSILNFTPADANNHIVNTLLVKFLFLFGNQDAWVARLPNVLAFILYLYFAFKTTTDFVKGWAGFLTFLLLTLNPFLLDFFSLSRGYGLSAGFQITSIYYLLLFFRDKEIKHSCLSLIFGGLAVLSNFSVLNYWIVILMTIFLVSFWKRKEFKIKQVWISSAIITLIVVALIYEPVRKLRKSGHFYYGGTDGFYSDTLVSLTKYSLYDPEVNPLVFVALNVFLVLLLISMVLSVKRENWLKLNPKNILLFVLIFSIVSVVVQHYLFGTFYLIDRTALFFYPLLILVFCFSLQESRKSWYGKTIVVTIVTAFGINFFNHANLFKTATWYFDSHSVEILEILNEKGKARNTKVKVDFGWPFKRSVPFYYNSKKYPFVALIYDEKNPRAVSEADYYIFLGKSLEKVGYESHLQPINSVKKDTALAYREEAVYVFSNMTE